MQYVTESITDTSLATSNVATTAKTADNNLDRRQSQARNSINNQVKCVFNKKTSKKQTNYLELPR